MDRGIYFFLVISQSFQLSLWLYAIPIEHRISEIHTLVKGVPFYLTTATEITKLKDKILSLGDGIVCHSLPDSQSKEY